MTQPNLIVVCGPTASGKTRLGVSLALRLDGEIISVDSRQIYRGMDIGTGKDLTEYQTEKGPVPYHLIDISDPADIYTLWHYQRDFYRAFNEIRARNKMPVAVGGTGLYLEAVLKNYRIPNVPEDVELRQTLMTQPKEKLLERLKALSPSIFATTDQSSIKRVVRSLEVAIYGQVHEIQWGHDQPPEINPLVLVVRWDRNVLRGRILSRLENRLRGGMVDEVKRLIGQGLQRSRLDLFGLEYKHVARFLACEVSMETMKYELYHDICQFAKRQDTYFRGMERRGIRIHWVENADFESAMGAIKTAMGMSAPMPGDR